MGLIQHIPSWKGKLVLSFAVIVLVFVATAGFNLIQVRGIGQQITQQNEKVANQLMARDLLVLTQELKDISSGLMISRDLQYVDKYYAKRAEFESLLRTIGNTATTDEQRQWRSQLLMARTDLLDLFDRAVSIMQNKGFSETDIQINTASLYKETQQKRDTLFDLISKFDADFSRDADKAVASSEIKLNFTSLVMVVASGFVLCITIAISIWLLRSFLKPVNKLQQAAAKMAEGDFRHNIRSVALDEFGQLSREFDRMIDHVRTMLQGTHAIASSLSERSGRFRHFAQVTASANSSILTAIEEISTGADQQASQTEKSTQLVTELAEEVADISRHTDEMHALSQEARGNTRTGSAAVLQLQSAADRSDELLQQVMAAMDSFIADSVQIGHIVRTISEISTETNVLAVNAAIEAARAGQHGRGFSVIAEQVRQLSDETGASAKSIGKLTASLQGQIARVRTQMGSVQEAANVQGKKLNDTLQSFQSIEGSIDRLHGHMELVQQKAHQAEASNASFADTLTLVAAIAEETAAGVQEVNSTSIEQNDAIHQIAMQSDDIHGLAEQLFSGMSRFQIEN